MQVCRICLMEDTKLFNMGNSYLQTSYELLTNCLIAEDHSPGMLCWECKARLLACDRLRAKALRSQALFTRIMGNNQYNVIQKLRSTDRKKHNLTSSLTTNIYIDHADLQVQETSSKQEENPLIMQESLPIQEIQDVNMNAAKSEDETDNVDMQFDRHSSIDERLFSRKVKKTKLVKKKKDPKIDRRRKPASEVLSEALFAISDLSYDEQIEEIRKRRETANYKNAVFKCEDCFKGFLDEEAYNCHAIRHTDQSGPFVCDICKTHFKNHHCLRNHATSHQQKFTCKSCPYVTTRRHTAKLHEQWHNGTRYQCPHCASVFLKFSTYMGHIRIKHPSDFVCQLCGNSFVSEKGLSLHKTLKHRLNQAPIPESGPHCQQCDVRFATLEALRTHVKLSARHVDTNKKEDGRRRGARKTGERAVRGKRDARREDPISCEQCEAQLPGALQYYRHFRRAHPGQTRTHYPAMRTQTMCEVCGKMFQSLALLQDHSSTHGDAKLFACAQCGKSFQRKYRLVAHGRLHRAPRAAHACATCGKRFSSASNRQRHMFTHTGLKPFKCEMCGKCFKYASEKRAHITYVHLKKPWPKRARGKRRVDTRQAQRQAPSETDHADLVQPPWPACSDPKMDALVQDKPMFIL